MLTDRLPATRRCRRRVGRTLYRIVQEGLTNAAKARPGARSSGSTVSGVARTTASTSWCATRSRFGAARTRTPGSGLGLLGLTERAELAGGRLETAPRTGDFVLHGWIPWAA